MPMPSAKSNLTPKELEATLLRYSVSINPMFEICINDVWNGEEVCVCNQEEDAEFICECLNRTEYDRHA